MKKFLLASALAFAASTTFATVVNLSANPPAPNAGTNSGTYPYNPVYLTLASGIYTVGEVGIAGGGLYDAYTVNTPVTSTSLSYTDSQWFVSATDGAGYLVTRDPLASRYNTAAQSLAAYSALGPLTFTLASTTKVAFYINDTRFPYFGDDTGGVSLSVTQVPEPATAGLVGVAVLALGVTRRRRATSAK